MVSPFLKTKLLINFGFEKVHTIRTRPKRKNEVEGIDGYFMTSEELDNLQMQNKIAYRFGVFGGEYAYLKDEIFSNRNMVFEMHYTTIDDWKKVRPDIKTIYIFPSDIEKAKIQIKNRGLSSIAEISRLNEIIEQYNFMINNKDFQSKFDYIFFNNYDVESENKLINLVSNLSK